MNSALYSGWVQHRRLTGKGHSFRYRVFMFRREKVCELERQLALQTNVAVVAEQRTRDEERKTYDAEVTERHLRAKLLKMQLTIDELRANSGFTPSFSCVLSFLHVFL